MMLVSAVFVRDPRRGAKRDRLEQAPVRLARHLVVTQLPDLLDGRLVIRRCRGRPLQHLLRGVVLRVERRGCL